jgi:hypothetical protein
MDAEQFRQLVHGFAAQENQRLQQAKVRSFLSRINTCDGSAATEVRRWLREIEVTIPIVGDDQTINIVSQTVRGPLMFEIEHFLTQYMTDNNIDRNDVPWNALREHVRVQFLSYDEQATLRDELDSIRQEPDETDTAYSRRFREIADTAYPPAQRNDDQQRIMLRAYARGLACPDTARKLIENHRPMNISDAMTAVIQINTHTYIPPISQACTPSRTSNGSNNARTSGSRTHGWVENNETTDRGLCVARHAETGISVRATMLQMPDPQPTSSAGSPRYNAYGLLPNADNWNGFDWTAD